MSVRTQRRLQAVDPSDECETCRGVEIYRLSRFVQEDWVEFRLCRRCHAGSGIVLAIDLLTEDVLTE